jgi:aspartate/methionine/tyrosine aminotransferase
MSVVFEKGVLNSEQSLSIELAEVREMVEGLVNQPGVSTDKRFVYYLLAATGICTVPISSFCTEERGFRITLLELDEKEFTQIFITIANAVTRYLKS